MHQDAAQPDPSPDGRLIEVDERLESRLVDVESAVVTYLVRITDESRASLVEALSALDAGTSASDAFHTRLNALTSLTGMPALGGSSLGVVGQASRFPVVSAVPMRVFQAQIGLVRAAKQEIRATTQESLNALDAANDELATMRSRYVR